MGAHSLSQASAPLTWIKVKQYREKRTGNPFCFTLVAKAIPLFYWGKLRPRRGKVLNHNHLTGAELWSEHLLECGQERMTFFKKPLWELSCSAVSNSATPGTVVLQGPLSMGILQARILEWVAMPSSRGSSQPRDRTQVSCISGGLLTVWATREAHENWSG